MFTPPSKPEQVTLAYLQNGINIPEMGLSVATTLGGDKTKKGVTMFETATGLGITDGKHTWVTPWPNVKCYKKG